MSGKAAGIAVLAIVLIIVIAFIAVPYEGNPLYKTYTHMVLGYESQPEYSSPLTDCNFTLKFKAYKEQVPIFSSINPDRPIIVNRTKGRHLLLQFIKLLVEKLNMTINLDIKIYDNETNELLYEKTINIGDGLDREIHIYTNTSVIRPCHYVRVVVDLHFEMHYKYKITGETFDFTKDVHKERVVHVETKPTNTEYTLTG